MLIRPSRAAIILVLPQHLSQYLFAFSFTISPGRIEKIAPQFNRPLQRSQALGVVRTRPARQSPHAVPDLAYLPTRLAKPPVIHFFVSRSPAHRQSGLHVSPHILAKTDPVP